VPAPDLSTLHPPLAGPLPHTTTDRLDLQRFRPDDEAVLAPVFAKPEVWRFPYGRGFSTERSPSPTIPPRCGSPNGWACEPCAR
jgi:hypothetical protein